MKAAQRLRFRVNKEGRENEERKIKEQQERKRERSISDGEKKIEDEWNQERRMEDD